MEECAEDGGIKEEKRDLGGNARRKDDRNNGRNG